MLEAFPKLVLVERAVIRLWLPEPPVLAAVAVFSALAVARRAGGKTRHPSTPQAVLVDRHAPRNLTARQAAQTSVSAPSRAAMHL